MSFRDKAPDRLRPTSGISSLRDLSAHGPFGREPHNHPLLACQHKTRRLWAGVLARAETMPPEEEVHFPPSPPLSHAQGEDIYKRVVRDHMGRGFREYVAILMRIAGISLNYEIEVRTKRGGTRCSLLTLVLRQLVYDQTAAMIGDAEASMTGVSYARTWQLIQRAYAVTEGGAPLTDNDLFLGDSVQMAMAEHMKMRSQHEKTGKK